MYKRVMAVDVFLWGRHVGRIAPDFGSYYQFQYDPDFVRSGVQIAPICAAKSVRLGAITSIWETAAGHRPSGSAGG